MASRRDLSDFAHPAFRAAQAGAQEDDKTRPAFRASARQSMSPDQFTIGGHVGHGRYRLTEFLGKGGLGAVYRAYDELLETDVALKFLKSTNDTEGIKRFKREVLLARRVAHPNVCRLYDLHEDQGVLFLSMEVAEGVALRQLLIEQGRLPLGSAMKVMRSIAAGLNAAHEENILHRDLKPDNVMVAHDYEAKLLDFGIAKALDMDDLTSPGIINGTPQFFAPEVLLGRRPTRASDVFALGILTYLSITGKLPFKVQRLQDLLPAIEKGRPNAFAKKTEPEAFAVQTLVFDCLFPRPRNRPRVPQVVERASELLRAFEKDESLHSVEGRFTTEVMLQGSQQEAIFNDGGVLVPNIAPDWMVATGGGRDDDDER